ncbi:MAG: hypothetical protein RIC95_11905 [Vicingaceae bacterium]
MKKISILGIGWLGENLAKTLLEGKNKVVGTVSSKARAEALQKLGINAYCYQLGDKLNGKEEFLEADAFILTLPPSAAKPHYVREIKTLLAVIKQKQPLAAIFYTSSTSVYGNQAVHVDESSPTNPQSDNAKSIREVEQYMLKNFRKAILLRLGGLVGPNRHPVHYLAGREKLKQASAPVNLVHQNEVIKAILFLLALEQRKLIYNLVCPEHPEKSSFYQKVAKNLKLSLPNFDANDKTDNKTVVPRLIQEDGYTFIYKSPYDFPESKE